MLEKSMNYFHFSCWENLKRFAIYIQSPSKITKNKVSPYASFQYLISGLSRGNRFFFYFLQIKSCIYNQNSNHFTSELNSGRGPKDSESQYVHICQLNNDQSGRTLSLLKSTIGGHSTTTWTEFCHFLTPPPCVDSFLYRECGQKQTFFDPLHPHLVHVVIECPLIELETSNFGYFLIF